MQSLRRRRRPVQASVLAEETGVSVRTIYRDIEVLVGQGAAIKGDPGVGYTLSPGFFLPPLAFEEDELDAIFLGLALVARRDDEGLSLGAANAMAKIAAVLPAASPDPARRGLVAGPAAPRATPLATIREAMRSEQALRLSYVDKKGVATRRVVWPVAVGFFEAAEVLAAWCETRRDFRHFRLDRIEAAAPAGHGFGKRRVVLLAEWEAAREEDGY